MLRQRAPTLATRLFGSTTNDPGTSPPQTNNSANNAAPQHTPPSTQNTDNTTPYLRTPTKWKGTPRLPYINQQDILEALEAHVNTSPLQHVFLLWGGKSVGKTGALQLKAAEWEKRGHPVIEVDLKGRQGSFVGGFDGTLSAFAKLLREATISAFKRHKRNIPDELMQKILLDQQEREAIAANKALGVASKSSVHAIKRASGAISRFIATYFTGIPVAKAGDMGATLAVAGSVGSFFTAVKDSVSTKLVPKEADFVSVFQLLEELASLQITTRTIWDKLLRRPGESLLPPIVIIREIQRLDHVSDDPDLGRRVFAKLFEYFEPRKQGKSRVPNIMETSDFLWSRLKQLLSSQESFKAKQMRDWDKAEAEEWLVRRTLEGQPGPVFTQAEFDKVWYISHLLHLSIYFTYQVWDFCGGHAGTIYFIHSYLTDGTPLDNVIDTIRLEVRDLLC